MKGEILFEKMTNISAEYIAEAALGDAYGNPRREKEENAFVRFLNSGWGVAMLCAIVSLAAVIAMVQWGRMGSPAGTIDPAGSIGDTSGRFSFSYSEMRMTGDPSEPVTDQLQPGDRFTLDATVVNNGLPFFYTGSSSEYCPHAQFVLHSDPNVIISGGIFHTCDVGTFLVNMKESGTGRYEFEIPANAAAGVYDLVLSYKGEQKVFPGLLTVRDAEADTVTMQTVAGFYARLDADRMDGLDPFYITLYEDGTYQYYETMISSHIGLGNYTVEDGIVTLVEGPIPSLNGSLTLTFKFRYKDDCLVFLAEESDDFMYLDLPDGATFERAINVAKPTPPQSDHPFSFGYERPGDAIAGKEVQISAWVINEGEAFTYFGDPYAFQPNATLYYMDDPSYTLIGFPPLTGMEPRTCTIQAGEVGKGTYGFLIPEDAPAGEYGLILSYGEAEARFDSVLTVEKSATAAGPELTEELERAILEAYLKSGEFPYGVPVHIRHYYGQFPSGAVVVMIDCGDYTTALWGETVGHADLQYNDGNRIKVLYGGGCFTLPEAYEGKILTDADLAAIENLQRQYCPYLYTDPDGPSDGA